MIIYLAAAEWLEHAAILATIRAPSALVSFFHGRGPSHAVNIASVFQHATARFVDSGAHSLRTAFGVTGRHTNDIEIPDLDQYVAEYIVWLKSMRRMNLIDAWVELDIGEAVGMRWVEAQRVKLIGAGLGSGLVNVWHSNHDWDYWLYLLREASQPGRSRYVAIEGHQPTRRPLDYMRFLHEAYRRGVRVHGFKMTKSDDLKRWPFYSVDSTSWLAPVYASAPVQVRTGGMNQIRGQGKVGMGRRKLWRAPIPWQQTRSWRRDILEVSARGWIKAERELTALWLSRGVDWGKAIANPEVVDEFQEYQVEQQSCEG